MRRGWVNKRRSNHPAALPGMVTRLCRADFLRFDERFFYLHALVHMSLWELLEKSDPYPRDTAFRGLYQQCGSVGVSPFA
jgi:hypothetical protein